MAAKTLCSVTGCDKTVVARAMCGPHYRRLMKHGSPTAGPTFLGAARAFHQFAATYGGDDCLVWPYSRNAAGYGQVSMDGRPRLVHRMVCVAAHGEPSDPALEAAHSCGNGHLGCVTPSHIRWATRQQNNADRIAGPRNRFCGATKLNEDKVRAIRADDRSRSEIADEYGITKGYVSLIRARKVWKDTA